MINGIKSSRKIKKAKTGYHFGADSIGKRVEQRQKDSFSRVMFSVTRLKRIGKIVCRKMFHETRLNYTFSKLERKERLEIGR